MSASGKDIPEYPLAMVGGQSDRERLSFRGRDRVRVPIKPTETSFGCLTSGDPQPCVHYDDYELVEIHFPDTKSVFYWRHIGLAPMQALNRVLNDYARSSPSGDGNQ